MKLDRNISGTGRGKYGLIKNRRLAELLAADGNEAEKRVAEILGAAIRMLEEAGVIDWGTTPDTEFFVMRLRDSAASGALQQYSHVARTYDKEYAHEVMALARRAGQHHPNCKRPD